MQFRNEYAFLSNMYPAEMTIPVAKDSGETAFLTFVCLESAFQGLKDLSKTETFVSLNGYDAKRLGRKVQLRSDWEAVKLDIMRKLVHIKFKQHPELADKLVSIPLHTPLIEHNTWNDTFWGVCNGKGWNHLGNILEEERSWLLNNKYQRMDGQLVRIPDPAE